MQNHRKTVVLLLFLFISSGIAAQLNFKVGYKGGFLDPTINNEIIRAYNADKPWLTKSFKDLKYLSGLVLGFRNRWDLVAIDVSWYGSFSRNKSEGVDPTLNSTYERTLNYGFSSISLGIENFIGNFSFGASIDIDKTDIRTLKTGRPDRFTVVDEWGYGSHFFVAWNVKSTQLEFSIRPFVQIPWKEVDLSPLADELEVSIPGDNLNENFMNFGVMFIFFNGPQ